VYDANGNRTSFAAYGSTDTYTVNNLNQYTRRNATNATYDLNGNLTIGVDGSTYVYDQQNRLTQASKSGTTDTFKYDGLNRQVSRTVTGQPTSYSVWDGWNLIEEYQSGGATTAAYVYGTGGLLTDLSLHYYYQDGSGSTSHLADNTGHLLEWYRYDLQGTPVFYNASNTQIAASNYGVKYLFTGQRWHSELGLYDLRNRFYSPDIGRFLQPDPIGFNGDPSNLYSYCGNNPVMYLDPTGLFRGGQFAIGAGATVIGFTVAVTTGPSLIGVLIGGGVMSYGIENVVASFSNDPAAVAALGHPTSFTGQAGRAIAGEGGQVIGDTAADVISLRLGETALERGLSGLSMAKDAFEAGGLLSSADLRGYGTNLQSPSGNFSSRYVFQGWDSTGYGYFDNQTHTEHVVGFAVLSVLGNIGDIFDFYSRTYNDPTSQGFSEAGAAILNSMNFSMALSSVFSALGGGGGVNPCRRPGEL